MHQKNIVSAGKPLPQAEKALIMIHGRGGSAEDILSLSSYLHIADFALLAPQATNNTWYPYSFLAPPAENEPWLSSALQVLDELVAGILVQGIPKKNIYFTGFSQGACLTLEYTARHAAKYGGIVAFTGGLIGDTIYRENYQGDFQNTPVFIGSGHPDPHVPVERVHATTALLRSLKANVTEKVYDRMGHTINPDEIAMANKLVFFS